jgi:hypothetical protein
MKNKVKSWFRYQHYSTSVVSESHNHFMTCLSHLETKCDKELCNDSRSADEHWKEILSCINTLDDKEIVHLYYLIRNGK